MNTIFDMIDYTVNLYKKACNLYPIEEKTFTNLLLSGEIYDDDNILNRQSYIYDEIISLKDKNNDIFNNYILLLSIYYFGNVYNQDIYIENNDEEYYYDEEEDTNLIDCMKEMTKEEYIEYACDDENDILMDLISFFLDNEVLTFNDVEIQRVENFIEEKPFDFINNLSNNNDFSKVISKFHPDLESEYKYYCKIGNSIRQYEKLEKMEIKSLGTFIEYNNILKLLVSNETLRNSILYTCMNNISENDEKLYQNILLFSLKVYYANEILEKDIDKDELKNSIIIKLDTMKEKDDSNNKFIIEVLNEFNIIDLAQIYNSFNEEDMSFIQKLSFENNKELKKTINKNNKTDKLNNN